MTDYGYGVEVVEGYDEAVVRTRMAMKAHGFSTLTEMHVGGILGPEAGAERQYLIMAVWNAAVDERRIAADLQVAVHLPCNVVVQETGATALVAALDPTETVDPTAQVPEALTEAARDALRRVLDTVSEPAVG